ncbi:hypothetical protein [uncultured Croceitalea sp.]|uniref:hypothetical protein n=1 Tax=uncultured Croceitalea sp. TaxID=1798908 RepID=UPI0033065E9A
MKRILLALFALFILQSCIPLRVAPSIPDYKLTQGKRFKKGLPKKTTFVFQDPKEAHEFYDYINTKFELQDYYVDVEVPFSVDGNDFFFSYYEVEILDKGINLVPLLFDVTLNVALGNDDMETYTATEENTLARVGNYYIAIEVFSKTEKDCLHEESISRPIVLPYLRALKEEYFSTYNYNEVVFKN